VAKNAAPTLSIVFIGVGDPIGSGFAESLARPAGRLTGFSFVGPELAGKNLEFLKQAVPRVSKHRCPGSGRSGAATNANCVEFAGASSSRASCESPAVPNSGHDEPDALLTLNDALFFVHRTRILAAADRLRLPTMFQTKQYAVDGALLAYAPDYAGQGKRAAQYVERILKGTPPGDLPVEQPTKFELVIDLKTAKALPPSLLLRATRSSSDHERGAHPRRMKIGYHRASRRPDDVAANWYRESGIECDAGAFGTPHCCR
jgi:ABC-type uncharacterized transport system substrate-binding protein